MNECIFCKFAKLEDIKILEVKFFYVVLDSFPVSPGHSLIIPKRHVIYLNDLNTEEWGDLKNFNERVIKFIEEKDFRSIYEKMLTKSDSEISTRFLKKNLNHPRLNTKPDAYNYGIIDGRVAGRTIDHLHWHIIPRYEGDMNDPRGEVRHVIPEMGNYKK